MILVDNSTGAGYESCARRSYYQNVRGWRPVQDDVIARDAGSVVHGMIEAGWLLVQSGVQDVATLIDAGHAAIDTLWEHYNLPDAEALLQMKRKYHVYQPWVLRNLVTDYWHWMWPQLEGRSFNVLAVEKALTVPLTEDPDGPHWVAKLDLAVEEDGGVRTRDHKTTAQYNGATKDPVTLVPDSRTLQNYTVSAQITGQAYIAQLGWPDLEFLAATADVMLLNTAGSAFHTVVTSVDETELEVWRQERLHTIRQLFAWDSEPLPPAVRWRRNTNSCMSYGKICPYLDICRYDREPWKRPLDFIPMGFKVERWDPFEVMGLPNEDKPFIRQFETLNEEVCHA